MQRLVVNNLMSQSLEVTSDHPQASVLGLVLFNALVSNMDSGVEGTLSKFPNDTELCGAINTLEGRDAIHWDALIDFMMLNMDKCKVLHVGQGNPTQKCGQRMDWEQPGGEGFGGADG
ncbi:rna-directed dna polymerase from mobile element jockey-like [Pitangus sulphuratus]|nr:rna-directed dna polymerase from mobile element jockey-like [Pitangus sulphuratus]